MMDDIIISVITPVYNAAETLPKLFETLRLQTFRQIEWLVVNDGSADNTLEVLNLLIKNSPFQCRIFDQDNQGVSRARNRALSEAKGQYVFFADADDFLNPYSLEVLYQGILPGYDFAFGNHVPQWKDGRVIRRWHFPYQSHVFTNTGKLFMRICRGKIRMFASAGLYKKSIIDQFSMRFNTTLTHTEDDLFLYQYLCYCRNAVHLNRDVYHYVLGDKNSIYHISKNRLQGTARAMEILKETMKQRNISEKYARAFENSVFREKFSLLFTLYFKKYHSLDFLELPDIQALEKKIARNTFSDLKSLKDLICLKKFFLFYNSIH